LKINWNSNDGPTPHHSVIEGITVNTNKTAKGYFYILCWPLSVSFDRCRILVTVRSWLRSIDATIDEVSLETDNCGGCFERFLLLGQGQPIEIDEESRRVFRLLSRELKNSGLVAQVSSREHISIENACDVLALH
jgi:hypothetical protein